MSRKNFIQVVFSSIFLIFNTCMPVIAQISAWNEQRRGSFYFGCGMNNYIESPNASIHIEQEILKNSYDLSNIKYQTSATSNSTKITDQLSFYMGYFFNYNQTWAVEVCYNPISYYILNNQKVHIKGNKKGKSIDSNIIFSNSDGNFFYINNGTSLLQINLARRIPLFRNKMRSFSADLSGKFGIGPAFIYAVNLIDSNKNSPHFSTSGGLNADAIAGIRFTFGRYIFLEADYKVNYALLHNIEIYKGYASQTVTTYSFNFNVGFTIPSTKHNPLFRKGKRLPKGLPKGRNWNIKGINERPEDRTMDNVSG